MALTNDQIEAQNFKDFYDRLSGMIPNGEHRLTNDELEEIDLENRSSVVPTTSNLKFSVGVENKIGSCAVNAQGDYKPFYEQVVSGTTPSRVSGECATGLSGVENVQLCSVYVVADDFTKNLLSATAISNDGATLAFELSMDSIYFGKKFYATVRYTKTNDAIAGRFEEKKGSFVFADDMSISTGSQKTVFIATNDDAPLVTTSSMPSLVSFSNTKSGNSYTSIVKVADLGSAEDRNVTASFKLGDYKKNVNILVPAKVPLLGAIWAGGKSSAWTRTDDAVGLADPKPYYSGMTDNPSSPFDNIAPYNGIRIVEDATAGTLVEIPKFYYKWTRSGTSMQLQITVKNNMEGFLCSPAHADRGDGVGERDYIYVGRYHCASSKKSVTGAVPWNRISRATARSGIHSLGANVWQFDFAIYWTICMLYLVEFADWNSQAKIGGGCSTSGTRMNTGYTDSMPYHTGTTASSIAQNAYGGVQYRYIEGLWSNMYNWVDGIYFLKSSTNSYCIKNPANFSDDANGTYIGARLSYTGLTSKWSNPTVAGFEYALVPSERIATTSSDYNFVNYCCDLHQYVSTGTCLMVGACYNKRTGEYGLFYFNDGQTATSAADQHGARLMVLPPSRLT